MAMATCYSSYELPTQSSRTVQVPVQKDYSRPLHVDCSVEYELPNQAKPPQGVRNEPLLMIHPCYFRKIESQRRSPFINNLPATTRQQTVVSSSAAVSSSKRRVARTHHHPQYPLQYTSGTSIIERYPQSLKVQQQQQQHTSTTPIIERYPQSLKVQQQQQHSATTPIIERYPQSLKVQQQQHIWEPLPPLMPISAAAAVQQQSCCKRDVLCGGAYNNSAGSVDSGHWTDPDRSPDRPEDKHILTGKYRQYLRAHRLHPYVSSAAIPIAASAFPQIHQQVCYNV